MNQWDRLDRLIGKEKRELLQQKTILVLGLGGVGGSAVEHLARNGIENFILVDYDKIDITNLNRQIMTLHSNIDQYKVDVVEKRLKDINPHIQVIKLKEKMEAETLSIFWTYPIDYIIDANDTMEVKKELIRQCIFHQTKWISCMGTGNKCDPTQLTIMDIRKTSYDPMAKVLRKMVREENIKEKIPVVVSKEAPLKKEKVIATSSFVPNAAGLLAAYYVINDLLRSEE